jgi:hypothetical protein
MIPFSSTRSIRLLKGVPLDDTPPALCTQGTLSHVSGTLLFSAVFRLLLWNKWLLPPPVMLFNCREVKESAHS